KLDAAKFLSVLGPKAGGALNLDRLTREDDLGFFLLLSSLASVLGNPGQANYNAANLVLEAIAHRRRLEGRPATVIQLGLVSGEARTTRLAAALVEAVSRITGADAAKIPPNLRLTDVGLDSLMATQLSSWLHATVGVNVPPMRLLKGPTLAELAGELAPAIGA